MIGLSYVEFMANAPLMSSALPSVHAASIEFMHLESVFHPPLRRTQSILKCRLLNAKIFIVFLFGKSMHWPFEHIPIA